MANRKQLEIMRQGVEAWNAWREENPDAKINLRWAKLNGLDLSGANFCQADIRGARFRNTVLVNSNFTNSTIGIPFSCYIVLIMVMLLFSCVYAITTHHFGINFSVSGIAWCDYLINFTVSFVIKLVLSLALFTIAVQFPIDIYIYITDYITFYFETDFSSSDLTEVTFDSSTVYLSVIFSNTILVRTSFQNVRFLLLSRRKGGGILCDNDVCRVLVHANGQRLDELSLRGKNLQGAYLAGADLGDMDLRATDLMQVNLSGANITGAKLYGSARENWIIDGIRCDYIYWDEAGEERTPPDRDFRPGEFEDLHKQLPTFEYFFEQGFTPLDPLIMSRVVQAINEKHEDFLLDLVNFDKRGQPHATFTVCRFDYIDEARGQLAVLYERTIEYLTRENEDKKRRIDKLEDYVDQLIGKFSPLKELSMGNTYNNYGQVAAMGEQAIATGNTFQQIVSDISRLHEEMQNKAATPEQQAATQDIAKAKQAAEQGDKPTMQQHLKNAGQWALDCAQKVGTDVLTEYLKKLTLGM